MEIGLQLVGQSIQIPKVMVNLFVTNNCFFTYSLFPIPCSLFPIPYLFLYFLIHSISYLY